MGCNRVIVADRDSETDILKGAILVELAESVGILLQDQRRRGGRTSQNLKHLVCERRVLQQSVSWLLPNLLGIECIYTAPGNP